MKSQSNNIVFNYQNNKSNWSFQASGVDRSNAFSVPAKGIWRSIIDVKLVTVEQVCEELWHIHPEFPGIPVQMDKMTR